MSSHGHYHLHRSGSQGHPHHDHSAQYYDPPTSDGASTWHGALNGQHHEDVGFNPYHLDYYDPGHQGTVDFSIDDLTDWDLNGGAFGGGQFPPELSRADPYGGHGHFGGPHQVHDPNLMVPGHPSNFDYFPGGSLEPHGHHVDFGFHDTGISQDTQHHLAFNSVHNPFHVGNRQQHFPDPASLQVFEHDGPSRSKSPISSEAARFVNYTAKDFESGNTLKVGKKHQTSREREAARRRAVEDSRILYAQWLASRAHSSTGEPSRARARDVGLTHAGRVRGR